jgi:hypothetical protein
MGKHDEIMPHKINIKYAHMYNFSPLGDGLHFLLIIYTFNEALIRATKNKHKMRKESQIKKPHNGILSIADLKHQLI